MTEPEQKLSRINRKKRRNRANNVLNILIAVVVVLIIIVSSTILFNGGSENQAKEKKSSTAEQMQQDNGGKDAHGDGEEDDIQPEEPLTVDENFELPNDTEGEVHEQSGVITYMNSEDDVIAETIVDTSWGPIGTTQTGEHVSLYDGRSVDWEEKKKALAYATELPIDTMVFWKIKNGGSPQHSIGIVSSADKTEKYRVYLEWIDEQGWKPVKMDVLKTLDFDY